MGAVLRRGVYPGTFNPPTMAHLAIAEAAVHQRGLHRLDLAVSYRPINKTHVQIPTFEHRLAVLHAISERVEWLGVTTTEATLIVDIAEGYDVVVMGADKWEQVNDAQYYRDAAALHDALARLPEVALAPRPPHPVPRSMALELPEHYGELSSTAARAGRAEFMVPEAIDFDRRTGAWSDPDRYRRLLSHPDVR